MLLAHPFLPPSLPPSFIPSLPPFFLPPRRLVSSLDKRQFVARFKCKSTAFTARKRNAGRHQFYVVAFTARFDNDRGGVFRLYPP